MGPRGENTAIGKIAEKAGIGVNNYVVYFRNVMTI